MESIWCLRGLALIEEHVSQFSAVALAFMIKVNLQVKPDPDNGPPPHSELEPDGPPRPVCSAVPLHLVPVA